MTNENEVQPWLDQDALTLNPHFHNLPKHPKCLLPKYDPNLHEPPKDHVKKFILVVRLMNVRHEYVVYRLFPYTFENKASTWYFNLPIGFVDNWNEFPE